MRILSTNNWSKSNQMKLIRIQLNSIWFDSTQYNKENKRIRTIESNKF